MTQTADRNWAGLIFANLRSQLPRIFVYQPLSSMTARLFFPRESNTCSLHSGAERDAWFLEQMNSQLENDCYEWTQPREMDGPVTALRSPLLPLTKMPWLVLLLRQGKNVALYSSSGDFLFFTWSSKVCWVKGLRAERRSPNRKWWGAMRILALLHMASVFFVIKIDAIIDMRMCVQIMAACWHLAQNSWSSARTLNSFNHNLPHGFSAKTQKHNCVYTQRQRQQRPSSCIHFS